MLPGPDPRGLFPLGLSYFIRKSCACAGDWIISGDTESRSHGLDCVVCHDTGSGLVLSITLPLGPCVPFQGRPWGTSGPYEISGASICLCLSSETTARQARSRPHVPRRSQSRRGREGVELPPDDAEQDTKELLFRRVCCKLQDSRLEYPPRALPKPSFSSVFFFFFCALHPVVPFNPEGRTHSGVGKCRRAGQLFPC